MTGQGSAESVGEDAALGSGEPVNQHTCYWGTRKGVGKVYVQVVVDVCCSLALAKVSTSKMPVTACDLLYDRVVPCYEALGVPVGPCSRTTGGSSARRGSARRAPTVSSGA